ncbi:MAG: carboxypeptidase regulatory-like domain-containing protein [Candidatus Hydrogenedentes bacterium]|nr:carboxypeptidase regulatory-like domain-containing protein [Candidatus Hydrogenedentota bacterium]
MLATWSVLLLLGWHVTAAAQDISWSDPQALNSTAPDDFGMDDAEPTIATDRRGVWVAAWQVRRTTAGEETDWDLMVSRSTDKTATWSPASPLHGDAGTDAFQDTKPFLCAGQAARWLALWIRSDSATSRIAAAVSPDGAQSWGTPFDLSVPVPTNFGFSGSITDQPRAATDGFGRWIAAWSQEGDIFWTRSTDDGLSWTPPEALITTDRDLPDNAQPYVSTDGGRNWLMVWSHFGDLNGSFNDRIIAEAFSTDSAETWSVPAALTNPMTTTGATRTDRIPLLDTDGNGRWTVFWSRGDCCGNEESDLFYSQSFDNDFFFGTHIPPHHHFNVDKEGDAAGALATDTLGNWLMLFWTPDEIDGSFGTDTDVFYLHSTDNGETWSAPAPVNSTAASDNILRDIDIDPDVATDGQGTWAAVWRSSNNLGETVGNDPDILYASTAATGTFRGLVRDAVSGVPVDCAALRVTDNEPDLQVTRIVPTNKIGEFEVRNLAPGNYRVEFYSAGYEFIVQSVTITAGAAFFSNVSLIPRPFTQGIRGVVTDADNGQPLVGVHVIARIDGVFVEETFTCGAGMYGLQNLPAEKVPVTVALRFESANYDLADRTVEFEPGTIAEANPQLTKSVLPGAIAGVVRNADTGDHISNARITLLGRGNLSTESDVLGVYAMAAVPEGRYSIDASAVGFQSASLSRAVPGGDTVVVDFVLNPTSATTPGDVNADSRLDAVDVQLVINGALGLPVGFNVDVNSDGDINAVDVQLVIVAVLTGR